MQLTQMKADYTTNSHYLTYTFLYKSWENVLSKLGIERVFERVSGDKVDTKQDPGRSIGK